MYSCNISFQRYMLSSESKYQSGEPFKMLSRSNERSFQRCGHYSIARVIVAGKAPWERKNDEDGKAPKKVQLSKSLDSADYIWNADWQGEMRRIERAQVREKKEKEGKNAPQSGFLNIGRSMELDRLDTDLSDQTLQKTANVIEEEVERIEKANKDSSFTSNSKYNLDGWNYVPTRAEKQKWASDWEKAQRFSQGGTTGEIQKKVFVEVKQAEVETAEKIKESEENYQELKNRLFLLTFGIGTVLTTTVYIWKGLDIGASFGVGAALSLLYLRLLAKSVDGITGQASGPPIPSLLVPILIFFFYKRWNDIYAEDFGVRAEIIPMLLGFFSYKISTIIETFYTILSESDIDDRDASQSNSTPISSSGSGFQPNLPPMEKKDVV